MAGAETASLMAPQKTTIGLAKGSLLGELDSFKAIELKALRLQTVQSEGKGDMMFLDAGFAPSADDNAPIFLRKKKAVADAKDKRIKIEPASINLKAERDVTVAKVKKLALAAKPADVDDALVIDKTKKRQVIASRRLRQAEENCLARAVYFEARSESELGQMAVAKVILNRVRDPNYPKSICGVVYQGTTRRNSCQFSFACDGLPDDVRSAEAWARSKRVAQKAISGDTKLGKGMNAATNYHADYVQPKWAKAMRKIVKIGTHIFYEG